MLIDSHIHVGQFYDRYYSPSYISRLMHRVGVDYYAVSSTSMCEEDYMKVLDELYGLIELDGDKVLPVMWITPDGLEGNIAWFLESRVKWRCLKIHPFMHQERWASDSGLLREIVDIARHLDVPLLIHTGEDKCCKSELYAPIIEENEDINFILAHGRPVESAKQIVRSCDNAYIDSAFMPPSIMKQFIESGLSHKMLWGTDMCIPEHYYPHEDMADYYLSKLDILKGMSTHDQYQNVSWRNAAKVFNL